VNIPPGSPLTSRLIDATSNVGTGASVGCATAEGAFAQHPNVQAPASNSRLPRPSAVLFVGIFGIKYIGIRLGVKRLAIPGKTNTEGFALIVESYIG
jgi:hypothetical protein